MRAPELAKQGIEIASISASNQSNHVTVEVRGDPASAAPVLAGRQPPGLIETVRGDGAELLGTGTNDSPPMRGGQRFAPSGCTTGFVAYDNLGYDLEFYVVTAGHCELETSNLAQYQPNANGNFFGSPRRNSYWDTTIADAMAIGPVSPDEISNDVAILEGGQTYRNIYSWEGLGGDTEGQTDCMSAYANAATIYECGTLLNDSLDANLGGRIFPYMREVSYDCFLGDSGSPHFSGTTAHGITSGRRTSNGNCFYSHTYDVIRALGLDGLRTSDGPGPSTRDYSGDGRADMLGINDIDGRLRVFLGNGTGGFSGTVTLGSGWAPYNAIAGGGDYSGGGKADLLAINDTNGNLYLYPGTGSSGFGAPSLIGGGWATSNAIAGGADHTRDGEPDLFAINDSDGRLRLYPGTGVGGLGTSLDIYGPGWAPYNNIAAGADYTGDGNPDLLGINSTDGRLRIFPGTGEAGLESPITFGPGWNVFTIAGGADYTSDRNADLLAINNASGVLYLYPGNGAGSFLAALTVGPGWSPYNTIA
jgi:hypothetical protein